MTLKIGDYVEFMAEPRNESYLTIGRIVAELFATDRKQYWLQEIQTGFHYPRYDHELRKLRDEEVMIIILEGEDD